MKDKSGALCESVVVKLGKHLFTFAVIADTHMNQSEDYSSSPYPANALAKRGPGG